MIDRIQRVILENQIVLGEALWTVLHDHFKTDDSGLLKRVLSQIAGTRALIDEESGIGRHRHVRKRMTDLDLIHRIQIVLDTAEDGEGLIEVARNAHRAEIEMSKLFHLTTGEDSK